MTAASLRAEAVGAAKSEFLVQSRPSASELSEAKGAPLDALRDAATAAGSFMNVGRELKKAGLKYTFGTDPFPMYTLHMSGGRYGIVNRKYAEEADVEVGDIAIGKMG